jgi:superfamily II DNA or RNA helicase
MDGAFVNKSSESSSSGVVGQLPVGDNELWWLQEGAGSHGDTPAKPDAVVAALHGTFTFAEESDTAAGLRAPQLRALHAILAHRSTEDTEPITVVMPTGTGKTETMLATYCHRPAPTLVVVPSEALRSQIAKKFATLGVLPRVGSVTGDFLCPDVFVLKSTLLTTEQVDDAMRRANVVVATAQALWGSSDAARSRLVDYCDRLFIDEAHHVAARTWRAISELFADREIVQFTATPYREDGQHLGGRIAYAYPLRFGQQNGYFARINYHSVTDLADPDRALAAAAIDQLRTDVEAGLDHLLMARVSSVARAKEIIALYQHLIRVGSTPD